jgi:hypothetical protein
MVNRPQNEILHKNRLKNQYQRAILPIIQLKYACCFENLKIKLKKLKKRFYEKSQLSAFLTKNGKKGQSFS